MRRRKQIMEDFERGSFSGTVRPLQCLLEVLIDIRDILEEKKNGNNRTTYKESKNKRG